MENRKLKRHFLLIVPAIAFLIMLSGELAGAIIAGVVRAGMSESAWIFLCDTYLPFIGIWIVLVIYLVIMEKPIAEMISFGKHRNTAGMFLAGLAAGFVLNLICAIAAMVNRDIALSWWGFDSVYLIAALIVVTIQSSAEEALCRGYMYGALRERYGVALSMVVNSCFFAALHLGNPGISWISLASIAAVGVLETMVVEYLDSFWMAAAIHTGWNYMQNIILGLPNSGLVSEKAIMHLDAASDSLIYSVEFGVEGGIISIIVCVAAAAFIYFRYGRRKNVSAQQEEA